MTAIGQPVSAPAPGRGAPSAKAVKLDREDSLADFQHLFVGSEGDGVAAYLDGNSLGRPLVCTAERLADFIDGQWGQRLIRSWSDRWMDEPLTLGDRLGEVVLGARSGQVFLGDSTSVLLYKLIRAAIPHNRLRNEIVIDRENFPTDRFILEGIAAHHNVVIKWLEVDPDTGVSSGDLARALSNRTALVVLSHVAFKSGYLADAKALTEQVHAVGGLVLWDLCHSAGVVPIHLDDWGVDLAVGCTYKYLNGGPGSPAFGFVGERLQHTLQQPIWGWMGSADPFAMPERYEPATGIRRFLSGTPAILAMQPMKDMIDLIEHAGMTAIRNKSIALTEFAIDLFTEHLQPQGVRLATPRDHRVRGSHITVEHDSFKSVTEKLWEVGVIPDFRPPRGLRIGLSPLSTSFAEVEMGVRQIRAAMRPLP